MKKVIAAALLGLLAFPSSSVLADEWDDLHSPYAAQILKAKQAGDTAKLAELRSLSPGSTTKAPIPTVTPKDPVITVPVIVSAPSVKDPVATAPVVKPEPTPPPALSNDNAPIKRTILSVPEATIPVMPPEFDDGMVYEDPLVVLDDEVVEVPDEDFVNVPEEDEEDNDVQERTLLTLAPHSNTTNNEIDHLSDLVLGELTNRIEDLTTTKAEVEQADLLFWQDRIIFEELQRAIDHLGGIKQSLIGVTDEHVLNIWKNTLEWDGSAYEIIIPRAEGLTKLYQAMAEQKVLFDKWRLWSSYFDGLGSEGGYQHVDRVKLDSLKARLDSANAHFETSVQAYYSLNMGNYEDGEILDGAKEHYNEGDKDLKKAVIDAAWLEHRMGNAGSEDSVTHIPTPSPAPIPVPVPVPIPTPAPGVHPAPIVVQVPESNDDAPDDTGEQFMGQLFEEYNQLNASWSRLSSALNALTNSTQAGVERNRLNTLKGDLAGADIHLNAAHQLYISPQRTYDNDRDAGLIRNARMHLDAAAEDLFHAERTADTLQKNLNSLGAPVTLAVSQPSNSGIVDSDTEITKDPILVTESVGSTAATEAYKLESERHRVLKNNLANLEEGMALADLNSATNRTVMRSINDNLSKAESKINEYLLSRNDRDPLIAQNAYKRLQEAKQYHNAAERDLDALQLLVINTLNGDIKHEDGSGSEDSTGSGN